MRRGSVTVGSTALAVMVVCMLVLPGVAVAALGQPYMGNTIVGNGYATVGWWAPGVPMAGWSSELQYSTDSGFASGVTSVVVPGGPIANYGEYTLTGMTNGSQMFFRVRSSDGLGDTSAWSAPMGVTPYPPLPNSTWIFRGAAGTRLARMTWNAAARAVRYQVQRADNSGFTTAATIVYDGPALNKTNTQLTSGKTYWYRVRSVDTYGRTSAWSNTISIRPR